MDEDSTKKSTSDTFREMWQKLQPNQKRYAIARLEYPTKKLAAESVGIEPNTVYSWNGDLDVVIDYMLNNSALAALGIIEANATKAAMIKARGLDSDNEKIRQDTATEILDRNLGKPTQRQETKHGGAVSIVLDWGDNASDND